MYVDPYRNAVFDKKIIIFQYIISICKKNQECSNIHKRQKIVIL